MKKILITNDDGIAAPGIKALTEVMHELGEIYIIAPDSAQSGLGHASQSFYKKNSSWNNRYRRSFPAGASYNQNQQGFYFAVGGSRS